MHTSISHQDQPYQPSIFAVRGVSNVGKSGTLLKVVDLLRRKYPTLSIEFARWLTDVTLVVNIGGWRIGLESQGDPNGRLTESLSRFVKTGCLIIICATRTSGQTVAAVNGLEPHYQVIWLHKISSSSAAQQQADNLAMAEKIVGEVERILSSMPPSSSTEAAA